MLKAAISELQDSLQLEYIPIIERIFYPEDGLFRFQARLDVKRHRFTSSPWVAWPAHRPQSRPPRLFGCWNLQSPALSGLGCS